MWTGGFAVLFGILALMCAGQVWYVVKLARRAYLADRLIDELGSYEAAARHVEQIKRDNEIRLAGAVSLHAFTKGKRK